jgi:ADP-ribosylglycohydrolase
LACRVAPAVGVEIYTIAAITGAIVGSRCGLNVFPVAARETVSRVNSLELEEMARRLLQLRNGSQQSAA